MFLRLLRSEWFVPLLCVLLPLALGPFTPGLLSTGNLLNAAGAMLPLLLAASGQTVVLTGGGIDLSATGIIALASVAGASVMSLTEGWMAGSAVAVPAAIGLMLLTGGAVGCVNGLAVAHLRMPAFIVTLTTMMAVSGLAVWSVRSRPVADLPPPFLMIGQSLPVALAVGAGVVVLLHLLLTRSIFGRRLQALGHNARTAHVSGVPVARTVMLSYVISGLCAAGASVLLTARLETGSPVMGDRMMLDIIGAAVIGGTSLFGGRGSVLWTLSGVLFLTLLDNALNLTGLSHFTIMMIKGAVILLAAALDTLRHRARLD